MPLSMQVKLLRVLQEKSFERVGGINTLHSDVRILAATRKDLEQMIESGSSGRICHYRLNVFPIEMPPLRARRGRSIVAQRTDFRHGVRRRGSVRFVQAPYVAAAIPLAG